MMNCIFCFIVGLLCLNAVLAQSDRVLMSDVKVLTLNRGLYTTARRLTPIPQLQCLSGCGYNEPAVVQCYNRGTDGTRVQWECKAQLRNNVRFGELKVSCEGYDSSSDPYILAGSCGLKYRLESTTTTAISGGVIGGIAAIAITICGIIFCCKCCPCCPCHETRSNRPYVPAPTGPVMPGGTTIINNPAPYYPPTYHHYHGPSHYGGGGGGGGGTHESSGFADSETR